MMGAAPQTPLLVRTDQAEINEICAILAFTMFFITRDQVPHAITKL